VFVPLAFLLREGLAPIFQEDNDLISFVYLPLDTVDSRSID
jgi:hypothetical protein